MTTPPVSTNYGEVSFGEFRQVLAIPGRYLNDHCLILRNGQWHLFGIAGEKGGSPRSEVSFAHATSANLETWTLHSDVIECSGAWPEIRNVYAPFVCEHDGLFYMLYCAVDEKTTQRICLATSTDLFEWQRYAGNPVIVPSVFWSRWPGFGLDASDKGSFGGCRDPHILKLSDGRFVAYWVSRLQEKFGKNLTCVATSISHDLVHWQEVGPVFSLRAWHQPLTMEVESPCVVFKDNRFWLFFKHGWWTHVVTSDSPFDFFGCEPFRLGFSHASEVFFWNDQWWITHCNTDPRDYLFHGTALTKGLFLGRLDWPEGKPPRFKGTTQ